jgi:putative peptidoglycan lipid II flippase
VLAPQIVSLYAGGYTGAARTVTIEMTRYCAPQIFCYGMFVMLGQILNARDRFGPMMWTPALANVVMIATLGAFMVRTGGAAIDPARLTGGQVRLLALGTTLGVVLQTAAVVPYAVQAGMRFRPRFDWRGTGLGASARLARWTVLTVLVGQVGTWLVTAIGNTMDGRFPGDGVGFIAFSDALVTWILPQAVITVSIATALLPRMSRAAQAGDRRGVRASVSLGTRVSACAVVPCAFALLAFGRQITAVLFGHGNADPAMVRNTGFLLMALAPGLIPYSAQTIMLRGFYAYEDTKTPFKAALWAGAVNLVLSSGVYLLLQHSPWAMLGVCAASSATYVVAAAITARLLHRRLHGLEARRIVRTHAKLGGASAAAAVVGACAAFAIELALGQGTVGALSALLVGGAAFAALFLAASRALRIREIETMLGLVRARLAG